MKAIMILVLLCGPVWCMAQQGLQPMDEPAYDPKKIKEGLPAPDNNYYKNKEAAVVQSVGGRYNEEELNRMARKDVNGIASTVAGVQSVAGGTPDIRGAGAAGTAYFVDGVRVYGALPIITK